MTNFEILYQLAEKITNIYDQIFYLTSKNIIDTNSNDYNNLMEEVKILVLQESNFLSSLKIKELDIILNDLRALIKVKFELTSDDDLDTIEGIEIYLKSLSSRYDYTELEIDPDVLLRLFDRLKNQTHILCGDAIKMKLRTNDSCLISYEVSIWDLIMSILNIQTLKNVKKKLDTLIPTNNEDIKFIKDLNYELDCFKLTYFYATFASEICAIYASNDIDKIVMPNIDKLRKLDTIDDDLFNAFLLMEAKITADDLASIDCLEYNPECISYFLRVVTSFEVLINNMDKVTLGKIEEYCNSLTNDKNLPCMEGINTFIKRRIKRNK